MIFPDFKFGKAVKGAFLGLVFTSLIFDSGGPRSIGFIDLPQPWSTVVFVSAALIGAFMGGFYHEDLHDVDLGQLLVDWYFKRRE